jgi:lipopolysaccharide transport system ATP-binding protein
MQEKLAIITKGLSKSFAIYEKPHHRLLHSITRNQKKYHQDFVALRDISLEIGKGETVGIIGSNGSGKSTLLQIICGTLAPSSGSVETCGRIAALLELGSGFNPEFSGRENVYMNAAVLGLGKGDIDRKFDSILKFSEIGEFINQPVKTYSSGMLMRLAFSVAINSDPEILIVDEALAVGDERFQRKCFSRIEEIKRNGATILFVSHSGSQIVELCDRAILLDKGEVLSIGTPKEIVGKYQKLLYTPAEKRIVVREELKQERSQAEQKSPQHTYSSELTLGEVVEYTSEFYDENLLPASTLSYETHGVKIHSPKIINLSGHRVNCLIRGRRYAYQYTVEFQQSANFVRFGMLIKSTSGLELGGSVSAGSSNEAVSHVSAATKFLVEFEFSCALNPGTYFLNAGVLGSHEDHETFLHRLLDAYMFKVLPEPSSTSTGFIDFSCTPKLTEASSSGSY